MFDHIRAFHRPSTLPEAIRILQKGKGHTRIVAGGTDLVLAGDRSVTELVDITRTGLDSIEIKGGALILGATVRLADLEQSEVVARFAAGILARAAATCGSIQNRNMATVGGNLAHASPAADLVTPLLALEATVVLADSRGRKSYPLIDYIAMAHEAKLARSILVEIAVPPPAKASASGWGFQKLGRTAVDISLVNVAAGVGLDAKGRVKWARVAMGAVAPLPFRSSAVEERLIGRVLDRATVLDASMAAREVVNPISDVRASGEYRREMSGVMLARALEACAAQAGRSLG